MKKRINFAKAILRSAGQSCEWKIKENFFYLGAAAGVFVAAILLLIFKNSGGIGFAVLVVSAYGFYWFLGETPKYYRHLEGERRTREELEPIIRDGYYIFNDMPGDKFNVDFLIIGPSGIYVIKVKNPKKYGEEKIFYDDETIFLGARALNNPDPIREVKNHALWVKNYLKNVKNTDVNNIKPVVLFPKIMIPTDEICVLEDIWILNPKRFVDHYLPKQNTVFSPEEIREFLSVFRARIHDTRLEFDD